MQSENDGMKNKAVKDEGQKCRKKNSKPESTPFTSQTTICIHGEQMQSEQTAYGETEAENGIMT